MDSAPKVLISSVELRPLGISFAPSRTQRALPRVSPIPEHEAAERVGENDEKCDGDAHGERNGIKEHIGDTGDNTRSDAAKTDGIVHGDPVAITQRGEVGTDGNGGILAAIVEMPAENQKQTGKRKVNIEHCRELNVCAARDCPRGEECGDNGDRPPPQKAHGCGRELLQPLAYPELGMADGRGNGEYARQKIDKPPARQGIVLTRNADKPGLNDFRYAVIQPHAHEHGAGGENNGADEQQHCLRLRRMPTKKLTRGDLLLSCQCVFLF